MDKITLYNSLPIWLQNIACSLYGYKERKKRYGKFFKQKLSELSKSQWYSSAEIENYQNMKLQELIQHAYHTVPYYHDLFNSLKLLPQDIKNKEDLQRIPLLTKETLRNNPQRLLSKNYKRSSLITSHTSGSTGKSLSLFTTKEAIQFQWAIWWRLRENNQVLFDNFNKHINFSGRPVVPTSQTKPPFWRTNTAFNQTIIPMQKILPETIFKISNLLNIYPFHFYIGYPSIIYHLCSLIEANKLKIHNTPSYIFSGCEKLYLHQKSYIERILNTTIYDQYGSAEGCCNATQCKEGLFHEDFEFGILDIRHDTQLEKDQGFIIGTGFSNYAMPLINYVTGDIATIGSNSCTCNRNSRIIKSIEGRNEDYIITPEGNKIMRFDYLFKETPSIKEAQIVQKKLGSITIKIVKRDTYASQDEDKIKKLTKLWISPNLDVQFEYTNNIERTPSGKFRAIINTIK